MKKFLLPLAMLFCVAFFVVGCSDKKSTTINGVVAVDQAKGATVYLIDYNTGSVVDSTTIVDSTFTFAGDYGEETLLGIRTSFNYGGMCVAEKGTIYINLVTDSLSGTPLNDKMGLFVRQMHKIYDSQQQHMADLTAKRQTLNEKDTAAIRAISEEYDSMLADLEGQYLAKLQALYDENKDNILGAYAFMEMIGQYQSAAQLEEALKDAAPVVRNFQPIQQALERLRNISATAVNMHYADVKGLSYPNHDAILLSELIDGKVALVDFWASWCGPCRQEIKENLIRIYEQYKDQGLQVVGLDISDKFDKHDAAVKELGITYPQLIDTTDVAARTYGIEGIPEIILIDKEGTIVARKLRGDNIEAAVKELLAK